jgi:hypothetical protein
MLVLAVTWTGLQGLCGERHTAIGFVVVKDHDLKGKKRIEWKRIRVFVRVLLDSEEMLH